MILLSIQLIIALLMLLDKIIGVESCPSKCSCRWKGGKETVECVNGGFRGLPVGILPGTQVLDLSHNELVFLGTEIFLQSGLTNLQKLHLSHCSLRRIESGSFARLTNLVELDLSVNQLTLVPSMSLSDCPGLRKLMLGHNPLTRIEERAFSHLTQLEHLELSRCELTTVAATAFSGLTLLSQLKLDGNRLHSFPGYALYPLKALHTLELHGNPWRCDCHLRDLKIWLMESKVPAVVAPTCSQPSGARGHTLEHLPLEEFACSPQVAALASNVHVVSGNNASLVCLVNSIPLGTIRWLVDGKPVGNGSRTFLIRERRRDDLDVGVFESSLILPRATERDALEYICVTENRAGSAAINMSLAISVRPPEGIELSGGQVAAVIVALTVLVVVITIMGVVLVARVRRRQPRNCKTQNIRPATAITVDMKSNNHVVMVKAPPHNLKGHHDSGYRSDLSPYEIGILDQPKINKPDVIVDSNGKSVIPSITQLPIEPGSEHKKTKEQNGGPFLADGILPNRNEPFQIGVPVATDGPDEWPPPPEFDLAVYVNTGYWPERPDLPSPPHRPQNKIPGSLSNSELKDYVPEHNADDVPDPAPHDPNDLKRLSPSAGPSPSTATTQPPEIFPNPTTSSSSSSSENRQPNHVKPKIPSSEIPVNHVVESGTKSVAHPRFRNSVQVLPPLPVVRLRDSPDEGYADEGEDGTEV